MGFASQELTAAFYGGLGFVFAVLSLLLCVYQSKLARKNLARHREELEAARPRPVIDKANMDLAVVSGRLVLAKLIKPCPLEDPYSPKGERRLNITGSHRARLEANHDERLRASASLSTICSSGSCEPDSPKLRGPAPPLVAVQKCQSGKAEDLLLSSNTVRQEATAAGIPLACACQDLRYQDLQQLGPVSPWTFTGRGRAERRQLALSSASSARDSSASSAMPDAVPELQESSTFLTGDVPDVLPGAAVDS